LREIRALLKPPRAVRIILGCVVTLQLDNIKKNGGNLIMKNIEGSMGKKEEDYLETAKLYLLKDTKELLDLLLEYDRNNIKEAYIKKYE